MEIKVNTGEMRCEITTGDANINDALYAIVGALMIEGYDIYSISRGLTHVAGRFAEAASDSQ